MLPCLCIGLADRQAGMLLTTVGFRTFVLDLQLVAFAVEVAGFDVGNELYELFVDCDWRTGEGAAGPDDNAALVAVMSCQQSAVAGRQALRSSWASNVEALAEMELSRRQRSEMSFSVEVGQELAKRLAKRRKRSIRRRKRGGSDPGIQSKDEGYDGRDPRHRVSFIEQGAKAAGRCGRTGGFSQITVEGLQRYRHDLPSMTRLCES